MYIALFPGLFLALVMSLILSYPPNLPAYAIQYYDYPIVRMLIIGGAFALTYLEPSVAIVLAMGYAILADDINKTHSKVSNTDNEQFVSQEFISLLPGQTDVLDAEKVMDYKEAQMSGLLNTVKKLEAQIESLKTIR